MHKKVLIYRIEDKLGIGPYQNKTLTYSGKLREIVRNHCGKTHPIIYSVYPDEMDDHFFCGFSSMTKLNKWFSITFRKELIKHDEKTELNHMIAIYLIGKPYVYENKLQSIFIKAQAELLTKVHLLQKNIY